jgi:hypothetical protein
MSAETAWQRRDDARHRNSTTTLASNSCIAETRSAFPVARAVLVGCKWPEDTTQLDGCWQALWPVLAAAAFRSSSKPCMLLHQAMPVCQACRSARRYILGTVM